MTDKQKAIVKAVRSLGTASLAQIEEAGCRFAYHNNRKYLGLHVKRLCELGALKKAAHGKYAVNGGTGEQAKIF